MSEIKINLNTAPYYDTTHEELAKGYIKYLATEEQVLQNRELNVAQGLIYGNLRKITDLIIEDGSIVSGCNFINDLHNEICTLQSGEIYVNGVIVKIPEVEWTHTEVPTGLAYVCVEVQQRIYTELDDPSLYDPAENIENHGNRGGHRLKLEAIPLILTADEFAIQSSGNNNIIDILRINDRNIVGPTKPKPVYGKLYNYLAQRTYDAQGDFIANGLAVNTEKNKNDTINKYNIRITKGRVYVKGYDYTYDQDTILTTKTATDASLIIPEIKSYINNSTKYYLSHPAVKAIDSVVGKVEQTNVQMSYTGTDDPIPAMYTPVVSVSNVHAGATTYAENTDFVVINNKIHWLGANHPSGTYYLDVQYSYSFVLGVDYSTSIDAEGFYVLFTGSGKLPVASSDFTVNYSWYLSRIDLIYIREDGMIIVKNGTPGEDYELKTPNLPLGALPLATIVVVPNVKPENYRINNYNIYRVPTVTLQDMKKRLDNVEYNIAMSKLETQAENAHLEREDATTLKNIFVDGFVSYDKADLYNALFDCTIDLFEERTTLPLTIESLGGKDEIVITKSDGSAIPEHGILTLPYTTVEADWQRYATHWIDAAPYYYVGLIPKITCDPKNSTKFYDTGITKIIWLPNRVIYSSSIVNNWNSRTATSNFTRTSNLRVGRNTEGFEWMDGNGWVRVNTTASTSGTWTTTTRTVRTSDIVGEEVVSSKTEQINLIPEPYIDPELVITVTGKQFQPERTVRILLDDTPVYAKVTEDSSAVNSTAYPGCIVTDANGEFIAEFKVPAETPVGTREVLVETVLEPGEDEEYYKSALDSFTSNSYIRHWMTTVYMRKIEQIKDTTYVTRTIVRNTGKDPVAQSFIFDEDTFISGIDLFFRNVSHEPEAYAWINIREMINGYPTGPIIYYKELSNSEISQSVSLDASVPLHIDFEYPLYCEAGKEYAFTVGANKNGYHLWYAKMGNLDITTGAQVTMQPSASGVMFLSSNNNTWTAVQDSDVKYVLYRAVFDSSVDYYIPSLRPTDINYTRSIGNYALANVTIPNVVFENTEFDTYYGMNLTNPYTNQNWLNLPLEEKIPFTLIQDYIDHGMKMSIKLSLSSSNDRVSPVINANKIEAFLAKYKNTGQYIQNSFNIQ
ncbi:MAG: hypothetical protein BWY47_02128 [Bacteroidetes bacterium ADurb.Bin302]|nr:MAG: hypothetical protein BWY47_02128 [Bacteroidetes bacterium ADurb.Bin302]